MTERVILNLIQDLKRFRVKHGMTREIKFVMTKNEDSVK
jgi:hypothetical protein